ncbi:MAG: DUF4041 domain-containing protein [Azospirillaceae bacterium]
MLKWETWVDWIAAAPPGPEFGYAAAGVPVVFLAFASVGLWRLSTARKTIGKLNHLLAAEQENAKRLDSLYSDPIRREQEVERLDRETAQRKLTVSGIESEIETLRAQYAEKKKIFDHLQSQAAIYDETIELAEIGFYRPHFRFDDSERYKEAIKDSKGQQKDLVKAKQAVIISTDWQVGGSRREGQKLENRTIRLTLRAFNNECDAAIANVTWRNAEAMRKRVLKAFEQINKENEPLDARINQKYLDLKLDELDLTIEREEKRKREREEAAELRRQEREEKKLQDEAKRAEKEEKEAEQRLARARAQAEKAVGDELGSLNAEVERLRRQLEEAHALTERAKSMAEQTKLGHVYVISNQGSFGEDVFKIGLTRRLDPHDRIKELGDASVPFGFDTHALVFSEDAPALESALHGKFESRRVNAANTRKEFFRVTLDEVEEAVTTLAPEADFYRDAEAQEYHETLMLRQQVESAAKVEAFPSAI